MFGEDITIVHNVDCEELPGAGRLYYLGEAIKKMDRKRESYHNYFTDEKWGDATNYDLCLNSSLGIEECVDVIIEAARKKFHLDF